VRCRAETRGAVEVAAVVGVEAISYSRDRRTVSKERGRGGRKRYFDEIQQSERDDRCVEFLHFFVV
jgi:hypothetical protein